VPTFMAHRSWLIANCLNLKVLISSWFAAAKLAQLSQTHKFKAATDD